MHFNILPFEFLHSWTVIKLFLKDDGAKVIQNSATCKMAFVLTIRFMFVFNTIKLKLKLKIIIKIVSLFFRRSSPRTLSSRNVACNIWDDDQMCSLLSE